MRTLRRNQRTIYYCLRRGRDVGIDENHPVMIDPNSDESILFGDASDGETYYNGDDTSEYGRAVPMKAYVSSAIGLRANDRFGTIQDYDRTIITDWVNCPIDENSVLFIDKSPEYDEDRNPLYDYIVTHVARELNHCTYYAKKVEIS